MLIDSHHHLWKYSPEQYGWISEEMSAIRRDFQAAQLSEVAAASGVDGFVSVQARQSIDETDSLIAIAATQPLIRGVVGWVPLADPEVGEALDRYPRDGILKGVRHVVQDEPDDRFVLGDDFTDGIRKVKERGLVYDLLIYSKQLPASIEFADRHEGLPIVLDHIAKPVIQTSQFDDLWEMNIRELAKRDHLTCKFSGVVTEVREAEWSVDSIRRYWDVVLEAFTPQRLMFGSDWPVCLLRSSYSRWLTAAGELAGELSEDEQSDFFANNAIRVYSLSG